MSDDLSCSFCGKAKDDVLQLIAGPSSFICSECVALCVRIVLTEHPEWRDQLSLAPLDRQK